MSDVYDNRVSRHTVEEEVNAGGSPSPLEPFIGDGDNNLRVELSIEVSGSQRDRPDTYRLLDELEQSILETIDEFETTDEGGE